MLLLVVSVVSIVLAVLEAFKITSSLLIFNFCDSLQLLLCLLLLLLQELVLRDLLHHHRSRGSSRTSDVWELVRWLQDALSRIVDGMQPEGHTHVNFTTLFYPFFATFFSTSNNLRTLVVPKHQSDRAKAPTGEIVYSKTSSEWLIATFHFSPPSTFRRRSRWRKDQSQLEL